MLLFVGNIDYRIGLAAESRPLYERALELRRGLFGEQSLEVAEAETALGTVCLMQGRAAAGPGAPGVRGAEAGSAAPGRRPRSRLARGLLGRVRLEQGDTAEAERLLAVAVAAEPRAPPHAELATNLTALGRVLHARRDYDGAEAAFREALTLRVQLFGEEHTRVSESRANLAAVMRDRGDFRGPSPCSGRWSTWIAACSGHATRRSRWTSTTWGSRWCRRADTPEAEPVLRESLEIRQAIHGADSPKTAVGLHALAPRAAPARPARRGRARFPPRAGAGGSDARRGPPERGGGAEELALTLSSAARTPKRRSWRGAPWRPTRPSWRTTIHHWPART